MKKLLLTLSFITAALTANISWDRKTKRYKSDSHMWSKKLDSEKYHQLALLLNDVITHAMLNMGIPVSTELSELIRFLAEEASPEALVLISDIDDFLEKMLKDYDDLD